jgi:hypothetical protein
MSAWCQSPKSSMVWTSATAHTQKYYWEAPPGPVWAVLVRQTRRPREGKGIPVPVPVWRGGREGGNEEAVDSKQHPLSRKRRACSKKKRHALDVNVTNGQSILYSVTPEKHDAPGPVVYCHGALSSHRVLIRKQPGMFV